MERLALLNTTRQTQQAVFDQGANVPTDPFARGDLGVAQLRGVDDSFEQAAKSVLGRASIAEVFSALSREGLDKVAARIAGGSSLDEATARAKLSVVQELVNGSAYYQVLPRGTENQIYLTESGDLVADPNGDAPIRAVDRIGNLHNLAISLGETNSNPIDSLFASTRGQLLAHIQGVIDQVNGQGNNGGGGTPTEPVKVEKGSSPDLAIPDKTPAGVTDVIEIAQEGLLGSISVDLDIDHTYRGDLKVELVAPDGTRVVLHDREGRGADDIKKTYTMSDGDMASLRGREISGKWKLVVSDHASRDIGKINSWKLNLETIAKEGNTSKPGLAIPDNDPTGITDSINVSASGVVRDLSVDVDISHTYVGDLVVELVAPDGTVVSLQEKKGGAADDIKRTFDVNNPGIAALIGKEMNGEWQLRVRDLAGQDVGKLNSWTLHTSTDSGSGPELTEAQQKSYYAGAGAILRRLAIAGSAEEKDAAFATIAQMIKDCPFTDVRALMIAGLHHSRGDLTAAARAEFDKDLAPLLAPRSPMYDEIFQITYVDGRPVANKRSLNVAVYYGNEDDDLIYQGGIKMIKDKGFVEQDSDKRGFKLFVKKVNQDDPDEPCQEIRMYVAHMTGRNMLSAMNDPDIDVIQYDGHSNLGRNIENSLAAAPGLAGNKVLVLGACATTDRLFSLRQKYPDTHKVQFVNTYESTYFNWREIDDKKVMNYSENMITMFGLTDSMSKRRDWKAMNRDLKRGTDSWSHSVDINYTNPGKLEWLMLIDLDRDGVPDGTDTVWNGGRVRPDEHVRAEFQAREPSGRVRRLDGTKVFEAAQSLDTLGRYNSLTKGAYRVRTIRSAGYKDLGRDGPMVQVKKTDTGGWEVTVNAWYSHASVEAIRAVTHFEFIKAAMANGTGRRLSVEDQNVFALHFAASSLRFDNSYADRRIWSGLLAAYNFPANISYNDFFQVIDEEHERRPGELTGHYRNIDEDKERIGAATVDKLKADDVGVWQGGS